MSWLEGIYGLREPEPNSEIIYENPQFVDFNNLNFNLRQTSPCIDTGDPNLFDPDGSIRDIGALVYNSVLLGDCTQDNTLNVLDIIYVINNCIFNTNNLCNSCSDTDINGIINILDIVNLVNIILQNN